MINYLILTLSLLLMLLSCSSDPQTQQENSVEDINAEVGDNPYDENSYTDGDEGNETEINNSDGDTSNNENTEDYGADPYDENADELGETNENFNAVQDGGSSNYSGNNLDQPYSGQNSFGSQLNEQTATEGSYQNQVPITQEETISQQEPLPEQSISNNTTIQSPDLQTTELPMEAQASEPYVEEIPPTLDTLTWIGYEYLPTQKQVIINILTRGKPDLEVFQEINQSEQPELVIRFFATKLRKKISRDIDATEFRSPVAYIRSREDPGRGSVDIVLTVRDPEQPTFFSQDGNVRLTYTIPDHYFGPPKKQADSDSQAIPLAENDIIPQVEPGSQYPQSLQNRLLSPDWQPKITSSVPVEKVVAKEQPPLDKNGLPQSFVNNSTNASDDIVSDSNNTSNSDASDTLHENINESNQEQEENLNPATDNNLTYLKVSRLLAVAQDNYDEYEEQIDQGAEQQGTTNYAEDDEGIENLNQGGEGYNNFEPSQNNAADFSDNSSLNNTANYQDGEGPSGNAITNYAEYEDENTESSPISENNPNSQGPTQEASTNYEGTTTQEIGDPYEGSQEIYNTIPGQSSPGEYTGKAMSLEFHEAPLNLVLKSFQEESGNNFTFPAELGTIPITVILKDVPWDEALKAILETNNLAMVAVGNNIVKVDRIEKMTDYMAKLEAARLYRKRLDPTKILVKRLSFANAEAVAQQITPMIQANSNEDRRISITADPRTNSIVAEAPAVILSKINALVERLDSQTPQIEIASRIVEVTKTDKDFFGMVWANKLAYDPGRGLGFGAINFPNSYGSDFSVDPGVSGQATAGNGSFRFGSINKFFDIDLLLKMEVKKGTTEVLQSNRVVVLDREEANILTGSSQFFRPAGGGTVITTGADPAGGGGGEDNGLAEITFNLELKVTPEVTADGNINMDVLILSESPGDLSGDQLPGKNTRELTTRMSKESGETAVIGGIQDTLKTEIVTGVPFFSELPIIGALFRSSDTNIKQTELLIMITPTILSLSDEASSTTGNDADFGSTSDPYNTQSQINNFSGSLQQGNQVNNNGSSSPQSYNQNVSQQGYNQNASQQNAGQEGYNEQVQESDQQESEEEYQQENSSEQEGADYEQQINQGNSYEQ